MIEIEINDTATGITSKGTQGFIVFIDTGLVTAIKTMTGYVLEHVNYLHYTQAVTYHGNQQNVFDALRSIFKQEKVPYLFINKKNLSFDKMNVMTFKKEAVFVKGVSSAYTLENEVLPAMTPIGGNVHV